MNETPTVLFVPGLRDHVEDHWQTIAARKIPGSHTVAPLEHDKLSCEARVAALEAAYRKLQGPVVLAAHSAGVMIAMHWARVYAMPVVSLRLFNVYGPRSRTAGTYGAVFGVFMAST